MGACKYDRFSPCEGEECGKCFDYDDDERDPDEAYEEARDEGRRLTI